MFIKRSDFVALVDARARAETRADWLMARVNQLELDCGTLKHELTGKPVAVPMFAKDASPPPEDPAETIFEDMGDDLARKFGVQWDDFGRIAVPTSFPS